MTASEKIVRRSLGGFTGAGYDKGRPWITQALWFTVMNIVFSRWWYPARWRPALLRMFGAHIGHGVLIRHSVRILWPWKLTIGSNSWIGEGVWIINHEDVVIGNDVCLSQNASLIAGSHDRRSPTFEYDNMPITIDDGAWIAFGASVLRGVSIGRGATIGARSLVSRDVPPGGFTRA